MLKRLVVNQFRNYTSLEFSPTSRLNIICGPNGSGKTSLLEAIYALSSGRSFRTHLTQKLIQQPNDSFTLFAELDTNSVTTSLGMKRTTSGIEALRRNNLPVRAISDIAKGFPVQVFHPQSIELVVGETALRRSWLDWGLFHVEQDYSDIMRQFRVVLKQRNALLRDIQRNNLKLLDSWDQQFIDLSGRIDRLRQSYLEQIKPYYKKAISQLIPLSAPSMGYSRGWNADENLADIVLQKREQDCEKGFTSVGPHRADLKFKTELGLAKDMLSRGQSKLLSYALLLCQIYFLTEEKQLRCVVLVDDLTSELDYEHQQKLIDALLETGQQLIVTALSPDEIANLKLSVATSMFHVEHGQIKRID